jgi:hypothetical protein
MDEESDGMASIIFPYRYHKRDKSFVPRELVFCSRSAGQWNNSAFPKFD